MDGWIKRPEGWEDINYRLFRNYPKSYTESKLRKYDQDTIFILAGGLNEFAENHQWVIRRLDLAITLYRIKKRRIICLGGGTYHKKPRLNKLGYVIHESTACAQYLINQGIDAKDIMREWSSYDTIANAFFSLLNYSIPLQLDRILVITSDFHMPRTEAIFNWIYSLGDWNFNLTFVSVDSQDLDKSIIQARKEREKQSLNNLQDKIYKIKSLKEFHFWFYTEHKAYTCDFLQVNSNIDSELQKSY